MRDIKQALKEHIEYIVEKGIDEDSILGIFVYGSQNYNMATDDSDIDTKVIIVPTLEAAMLSRDWYAKTFELPNKEHCEVMDIRHYVAAMKKQNINFVEILFTEYKTINPTYENIWEHYFAGAREQYARLDPYRCITSTLYQALNNLRRQPNKGKAAANGARLFTFCQNYLQFSTPYIDCIKPLEAKKYTEYKINGASEKQLSNIEQNLQGMLDWVLAHKNDIPKFDKTRLMLLNDQIDLGITKLIKKRGSIYTIRRDKQYECICLL